MNPLSSVRNWFTARARARDRELAALEAQVLAFAEKDEAPANTAGGGDKRVPPDGEVGFTGLKIINGIIDEEYLDALSDLEDRIDEYDRMRGMGSVAALVNAIRLPILGATFRVDPVDEGSTAEVELAERVQANLFEGMTHTWDDFLRHALLAPFYGFVLFEKVFEEQEGGWIGWRKFAPRRWETVNKWLTDESGGLAGVEQRGYTFGENGQWRYASGVTIPVEKLLLMSWNQEFGNFEGRGIFRDCYRHFYYADKLHELAAIRCERTAIPVPQAEYDPAWGDTLQPLPEAEREALLGMLQRLGRYESAGIVMPRGLRLNKGPLEGEAGVPFLDFIQHHEQQIMLTGLAQFLGLGQGENTGAYALSQDASSFFLQSLNFTARWVCSYLNRFAIRQLVGFNDATARTQFPTLAVEDIGARDQAKLAALLKDLRDGEFIDRPDAIGDYVREVFGLPEMPETRKEALLKAQEARDAAARDLAAQAPEAAQAAREAQQRGTQEEEAEGEGAPAQAVAASYLGDGEAALGFAEEGAGVGAAPAELADAEDAMRAEGAALLDRMVTGFVKACAPAAEARNWAALSEVRVPLVGKYAAWLRGYLMRVLEIGRDALAASEATGAVAAIPNELRAWARAQAESLADYHASSLRFAVVQSLMNDAQAGMDVAAALRNAVAVSNGALTRQVDEDLLAASEIAVERLQE